MRGSNSILGHLMITVVLLYEKQSVIDLVCMFLTVSFSSRKENLAISHNEIFGMEILINY